MRYLAIIIILFVFACEEGNPIEDETQDTTDYEELDTESETEIDTEIDTETETLTPIYHENKIYKIKR